MKSTIIISMAWIVSIRVWAAATAPVGYVSQEGETTAKGAVVSLRCGQFTPEPQGPEVILEYREALFTGQVGYNIAGTTIIRQWIPAPDAKVDQVMVGDEELTLLLDRFLDGRLITEEYGAIPVYFYFPGVKDSASNPNLCILVLDENQLQKIPKKEQ